MRLRKPIIFVHGGAGSWKSLIESGRVTLRDVLNVMYEATLKGFEVLKGGGNAVDAVVESIKYLEDSGVFNAGVGSVLDIEGKLCMDAGIMDGDSYKAGAVACISYPKNPIVLAKKVMEITDHVIICCEGGDKLARRLSLEPHPGPTPRAVELWKVAKEKLERGEKPREWWVKNWRAASILGLVHDTVGAVALDLNNRLAAGASTGGISFKLEGRVGDSCIPGAGFYADKTGAASATGIGETILLTLLTLRSVDLLKLGMSAKVASLSALNILEERFGRNTAGVILLSNRGEVASAINTEGMPRAVMGRELKEPKVAVWPQDPP